MLTFPGCKINIGLYVTGKRPDGFHDIESLFYPIPLCDALEVVPSMDRFSFVMHGLEIAGEANSNLCVKAWDLLNGIQSLPPVTLHLLKSIPMGAGLGGGSSDGTATLLLLNQYFELGLPKSRLSQLAAELGSDCTFFVNNQPAWVSGRGEKIEPADLHLKGWIVLVHPGIHVSTAEAYRMISPATMTSDLRSLFRLPRAQWKDQISNQFEGPMVEKFPVIGEIIRGLYGMGAWYSAMSGSGSAVYGLFDEEPVLPDFSDSVYVWKGRLA